MRFRLAASAVVLVSVAACDRDASVSDPLRNANRSAPHAVVGANPFGRTIDDDFAALADTIPGFGGLYYDATGRLTVFMKDPAGLAAHRNALANFISRMRKGRVTSAVALGEANSANIMTAKYSFRELLTVYRGALARAISDIEGLSSTDIDETSNRIEIGVRDAGAIGAARATIRAFGAPDDMLSFHVESVGHPNSYLSDALRPIPGGAYIEIVNQHTADRTPCTLGYNLLRYMGTFSDTVATARYFVTASHCTPTQWGPDSSNARQPFTYFASEVADYAGFSGSPCTSTKCRYADATVYQYYDPSVIGSNDGHVALPASTGDTSFTSYATITTTDMPYVGMGLTMVGERSGRQNGTVVSSCVNIYGGFPSHTSYGLLCQGKGNYLAQDGDSGAPVMTLYADGASATGIHIMTITQSGQAYRYFSPMQAILDELYWNFTSIRQLSPIVY